LEKREGIGGRGERGDLNEWGQGGKQMAKLKVEEKLLL
jgi:hypothetical protein